MYKKFLMDSAFCPRIGCRFGRHYSAKRDILNAPKLDNPVGGVSMKLTFLGANHEVTGSCTLLEAAGQRYLIDCGMEQGKDVYENQPIPVAPGEIDGVLATHAHIDHTGLLPLLVRNGFRGRIYATRPTAELCSIMLRDSAH